MPDDNNPAEPFPSVESLVAGTVALMTLWADPCPNCTVDLAVQRAVLAHKVVSNLFILQHHAGVSEGLRQVMGIARQRWMGLAHPPRADNTPAAEAPHLASALH